MAKGISNSIGAHAVEPVSLSELIHQHVRVAIEMAVHEELRAALGTTHYERNDVRRGYRNGTKARTLTGPTAPVVLTLPRATLFAGPKEWTSRIVPRYRRRMPEVNEAVIATYLAGGNTRRIRGALQPLLKAAPLSKSAVSRVIATLKQGLETWRTRSLADLDVIYVYADGFALRVRSAGKVVSVPVLGVVGVLPDGRKHLLALDLCAGESFAAWKGCLDDLVARGLRAPVLTIIDGNAGLRRASCIYERRLIPQSSVAGSGRFSLARGGAGLEKPGAALHLLHKFNKLHFIFLVGFRIVNKDTVTELVKENDLGCLG